MSIALSDYCNTIEAFDFSELMINLAKQKQCKKVHFQVGDMLKIKEMYEGKNFDIITCLGSIVVHLLNDASILDFLIQAKKVLTEKEKLILQLLNYDTVANKKISALPLIETDILRFERNYTFRKDSPLLDFQTKLYLKDENQLIKNTTNLYPICPKELVALLKEAGFTEIEAYSSFTKEALSNEKLPLVICAK